MLLEQDIQGFFASRSDLDLEDYALLEYLFETTEDPELVAASLCCEQSTAQWKRPGRDEDLRTLYGAKVLSLKECRGEPMCSPPAKKYTIEIAHPHRNFGPRIPNFLSAAAGEGSFYCPGISMIKWVDFQLPLSLLKAFEGPKFGLGGLRDMSEIYDRPFFIGVVKPNIGLSPATFAEVAYEGWIGGLDMAKDDEMSADTEWSPLAERSRLAGKARLRAEKESGQKKIYIANITDEVDQMDSLYEIATQNGANAVMINAIMMGIGSLRYLHKKTRVPILGHFTGTAIFSQIPYFGISSLVMTKLQRLAGADIIGIAGFGKRMGCSDEEVIQNVQACLEPWGPILPSLPVPGGSNTAETLPIVFDKIGHTNFGFICGRGVFAHPKGPAAGAKSLLEAWESIRSR